MKSMILITLLILSLIAPLAVRANPAHTVSPLVIDAEVEARDIITKTITITNTGTQPITLYPSVNNISIDEGGTIQEFMPQVMSDRTRSLASWIEISRAGIDLPIGATHTVEVTIRMHPSPVPGVYHAFIGFGHGENRDEAEARVAAGQAPGTVITVTIEEKRREVLKLARFLIDRLITQPDNQAASYTIKNPGDTPLTPGGDILIYDGTGSEVAALKINAEGASIAPGEEKVFQATVPTEGLFGKYKAFMSVEYGSGQLASLQDTAFFYVLPLKAMLTVFGVLLIVFIGMALYLHRKYVDDTVDDADQLSFHIRPVYSDPLHHDIDLTQK